MPSTQRSQRAKDQARRHQGEWSRGYDSGISAGRNAGLAAIATPFFVLCDDDFVFFRGTALEPVLRRMRAHPELDIVGGGVLDLPHYRQVNTRRRTAFGHPSLTSGFIAGLERRAVVQNFFIGRSDAVRRVGWDPELKMVEHADFFSRAYGELSVAFDPSCTVLHAKTPFDERYMRHREDVWRYQAQLMLKWGRPRGASQAASPPTEDEAKAGFSPPHARRRVP